MNVSWMYTDLDATDEAMVPFKGHSSLKQYMPKQPVKDMDAG